MLKILFSSSLVISLLGAVSIDELVNDSFEKNYDIKSLEKSIEIANHQIAIAKNWENPMIAFKTNEIMCILVINGKKFPNEEDLVKFITNKFPYVKTIVKNVNMKKN